MKILKGISRPSRFLCVALFVLVCMGASSHPVVAYAGDIAGSRANELPETGDIIAVVVAVIVVIALFALFVSLISKKKNKRNNNTWKYPY